MSSANQSATGKRCPQALSYGPLCLARFWDKGTLHLFHHVGRQLCIYTRLFFMRLGWRGERIGPVECRRSYVGKISLLALEAAVTWRLQLPHCWFLTTHPLSPNNTPHCSNLSFRSYPQPGPSPRSSPACQKDWLTPHNFSHIITPQQLMYQAEFL